MSYADKIVFAQLYFIIAIMLSMLWAFPVKWAWNYVITYLFGFPPIVWLQSFALLFIVRTLLIRTEVIEKN